MYDVLHLRHHLHLEQEPQGKNTRSGYFVVIICEYLSIADQGPSLVSLWSSESYTGQSGDA